MHTKVKVVLLPIRGLGGEGDLLKSAQKACLAGIHLSVFLNLLIIMEKTLIILKPDCMNNKLAGAVISRFLGEGFDVVACKMMQLDGDILREHYAHVADKPFFPEIEAFMSSRPVITLILQGQDAIGRVRELLGPTDSSEAPKGTIRGDYGTGKMENIAHASDSTESALAEIERFFAEHELF